MKPDASQGVPETSALETSAPEAERQTMPGFGRTTDQPDNKEHTLDKPAGRMNAGSPDPECLGLHARNSRKDLGRASLTPAFQGGLKTG